VNATNAVIAVYESDRGASFKGLTAAIVNIPHYPNQTLLYVADFTRGQVEIFDGTFQHVTSVERRLQENEDVPPGYGPFNVQNLGGNLYVAYMPSWAAASMSRMERDWAGYGCIVWTAG
jgi:hypothetical protein